MPGWTLLSFACLVLVSACFAIETAARQAVARATTDPAAAWFGGALRIQWTAVGLWLAWFAMFLTPRIGTAGPAWNPGTWIALLLLPPTVGGLYAQWRLQSVAKRIRGVTSSPGTLGSVVRPVLALILLAVTFGSALGGRTARVTILFGGLLLSLLVLVVRRKREVAETPRAVTAGELRDRVAALAARAGVRLRQLYVMPRARIRLANAFAVQNNGVMLTDYLLEHLGRDEVDAVLAHEMAHLRSGHPQLLAITMMAVATGSILTWNLTHTVLAAEIAFLIGMAILLAICRRFEYVADAGAVGLGAEPRALISGLARLARLNHVPVQWSRLLEWTLTHPSLVRRAHAIAARGALAPDVTTALLDPAREPEDLYPLPAAVAGEGKLFSTALKLRLRARMAWCTLIASVSAPALALFVLRALAPEAPWPMSLMLAMLAAAAGSVGVGLWLARFPKQAIRTKLAERLAERGLRRHVEGAALVGLTPGSESRIVEGFYVWDVGFLKLAPGRLDYAGEETSFSLRRDRAVSFALVSGPPSWRRTRCVRLTWQDDDGAWCTMRLFALDRAPGERGDEAVGLHARLEAWRTGVSEDGAGDIAFPAPRHHEVTSVAPRELIRPASIVFATVVQMVFAVAWSAFLRVVGVPGAPGWPELMFAAVCGHIAILVPTLRHREPARIERREVPARAA